MTSLSCLGWRAAMVVGKSAKQEGIKASEAGAGEPWISLRPSDRAEKSNNSTPSSGKLDIRTERKLAAIFLADSFLSGSPLVRYPGHLLARLLFFFPKWCSGKATSRSRRLRKQDRPGNRRNNEFPASRAVPWNRFLALPSYPPTSYRRRI